MKLFHENNHYCFSSYYIDQIPVLKCQDSCFEESQSKLAELLCEDMCYLSSNGNGQIAMEVVRIADEKHGNKIAHIISIQRDIPHSPASLSAKHQLKHHTFFALALSA